MLPMYELVLLVDDAEAGRALEITIDELDSLIAGGQLAPIYIHSKRRFLLQDVTALAGTRRS